MADHKEYWSTESDQGSIRISEDVVASIAALAASGTSTVSGIDVISRGYEHFTRKLHQLDARVRYLDA